MPIPDLQHRWTKLCVDGVLHPSHCASSFLCETADPVVKIVSAVNLHKDCPFSLLQALADNNPDREVWLNSFYEEKDSIESISTYQKITPGKYRALHKKGAPQAIPTMCVLVVKKDENLLPVRAKLRIVVLDNHKYRIWTKPEKYIPVLCSDSLRFLVSTAVKNRCMLKQGDCNNAFCNGDLPPEEVTIVRPSTGDPTAKKDEFWLLKKTLYELRRSPLH